MHFIVDLENVNSAGLRGANLLTAQDAVTIFYGIQNDSICREYMDQLISSGCGLEYIRVESQRKNALDFYVTAYIAEVMHANHNMICENGGSHHGQSQGNDMRHEKDVRHYDRNNDARIAIISRDKDFQIIREYWEGRGISVCVAKTILGAIAAYDKGNRRMQAERLLQNVHLGEKQQSLAEQIRSVIDGPETAEILSMIERKIPAREMYVRLLHLLGQKRGLEVYRKVKEIIDVEGSKIVTVSS